MFKMRCTHIMTICKLSHIYPVFLYAAAVKLVIYLREGGFYGVLSEDDSLLTYRKQIDKMS